MAKFIEITSITGQRCTIVRDSVCAYVSTHDGVDVYLPRTVLQCAVSYEEFARAMQEPEAEQVKRKDVLRCPICGSARVRVYRAEPPLGNREACCLSCDVNWGLPD